MILYALVCGLWMALNFWMMPWHALQVGQVSAGPLGHRAVVSPHPLSVTASPYASHQSTTVRYVAQGLSTIHPPCIMSHKACMSPHFCSSASQGDVCLTGRLCAGADVSVCGGLWELKVMDSSARQGDGGLTGCMRMCRCICMWGTGNSR